MITPLVAASMCRNAATRIRELAEAAYPGPWISDDSDDCWRLHSAPDPHYPTSQILKAPKRNTPFAEYWPDEATAGHIVAWSPPPALAAADLLENAADLIDVLPAHLELSPSQSLAVRLAEAFLRSQSRPLSLNTVEDIEARIVELKAKRAAREQS